MDFNKIEKEAVMVGLVSPHYAYELNLDFEDVLISKEQNTPMRGYGIDKKDFKMFVKKLFNLITPSLSKLQDVRKLWNKFYDEEQDYLHTKVDRTEPKFYDKVVMKKTLCPSL